MRYGMLIDLSKCIGCAACVMACKVENGTLTGVYWCNVYTKEIGKYPRVKKRTMPSACMHCTNAPCVKACPTGASYHTEEGLVLVDYDKCIGCRVCLNACPYNARHYNFTDQRKNPYYEGMEMTPFEKVKNKNHPIGKAGKCILCKDRLNDGKKPACVQTCPTQCRIFGDLDEPNSEVSIAIRNNGAKPLYAHLGTKPSVYYIGSI